MSSDDHLPMQDAISTARAKYVAQKYKQALDSFTDAIKLCPCEVESKKRKRIESADKELDQNAQENGEATGLPTLECGNPLHLQALNYRAGTFEKIPDLRRALADARRMMDIAPCSPEGYLRASKVLRMEDNPIDSLKVLTDGVLMFFERGDFEVKDLQRLDKARNPLKLKFAKVDPLSNFLSLSRMSKTHLPAELILDIFGRLELSMLCQCLRVSKHWKNTLTAPGCASLWRSLVFTGASTPKKPISFKFLLKLLSRSLYNIKEFVTTDARELNLDLRKFDAILRAGRKMERLEVANPGLFLTLPEPPQHLKYLSLDGFHLYYSSKNLGFDPYTAFLTTTVLNVETLLLSGLPKQWLTHMHVPQMHKLRHLRLSLGRHQWDALSVCALLKSTPLLEQLYLDSLYLNDHLPRGEEFDDCCVPKLKSLIIRSLRTAIFEGGNILEAELSHLEAFRLLTALNRGKKLKALELIYDWHYVNGGQVGSDIFSRMHQDHSYQYEDLEVLRLTGFVVFPELAERLFKSSVTSEKLHTFEICFPLPSLDEAPGQTSVDHIRKYQWLEGSRSIRCLGIYDFSFKTYVNASNHPLINFLQKFPSLEEVKLRTEVSGAAEYLLTVEDVLKFVKLKSMDVAHISGESLDKIRRLAIKQGVNLTWEPRRPKWPLTFEDD